MSTQEGAPPAPPQPTAEHEKLAEHVGVWNVDCTFYMDPSQPPLKSQATDTVEMFGPFWTQGNFRSDFFGVPYQGLATLGYDPGTGRYVSTWIDSMKPQMLYLTGGFDASGAVLEMTGESFDACTKQLTKYRTREEHRGRDERVFEMFMTLPDGNEVRMFTLAYTRAD
jgi:hypothetical protein